MPPATFSAKSARTLSRVILGQWRRPEGREEVKPAEQAIDLLRPRLRVWHSIGLEPALGVSLEGQERTCRLEDREIAEL
jgi:hypothetical protein